MKAAIAYNPKRREYVLYNASPGAPINDDSNMVWLGRELTPEQRALLKQAQRALK